MLQLRITETRARPPSSLLSLRKSCWIVVLRASYSRPRGLDKRQWAKQMNIIQAFIFVTTTSLLWKITPRISETNPTAERQVARSEIQIEADAIVQGGFIDWSALKTWLSVRLHVNSFKKVPSVRIFYGSGTKTPCMFFFVTLTVQPPLVNLNETSPSWETIVEQGLSQPQEMLKCTKNYFIYSQLDHYHLSW